MYLLVNINMVAIEIQIQVSSLFCYTRLTCTLINIASADIFFQRTYTET